MRGFLALRLYFAGLVAFTLSLTLCPDAGRAYPVLIPASMTPSLSGVARKNIIAFTFDPVQGKSKRIPLQIDEIEEGVALIFREPTHVLSARKNLRKPEEDDPFKGLYRQVHRIVLEDSHFEHCDEKCEKSALQEAQRHCEDDPVVTPVRIDLDHKESTAFLTACAKTPAAVASHTSSKPRMTVDFTKHTFTTDFFTYKYKGNDSILPFGLTLGEAKVPVLLESEILVHLKPKLMFNMTFDEKDIISQFTSVTDGPLSTGLEVAFAMDVMGLKVSRQICCDVSVYKDALYLPVMIDLPFSGKSFAAGSGLYFGLDVPPEIRSGMKILLPKLGSPEPTETKSTGSNDISAGAALIIAGDKAMGIGFRGASKGKKLTPFVAGPEDLKKIKFAKTHTDIGVFYDVTDLEKGFQHFDMWFYLGAAKDADTLLEYARKGVAFTVR